MDNNERILGIKEIARIYEINEAQLEELQRHITNISEDMQIRTMSMEMCRKKEKELDLLPKKFQINIQEQYLQGMVMKFS